MKNKKLSLNELKVKSFVTQTEKLNSKTLKGGYVTFGGPYTCENTIKVASDCDWC